MAYQTSIFDTILTDSANRLLDMLNDGIKVKFVAQHAWKIGNKVLLAASNRDGETYFNVLSLNGGIPDGFCANWRDFSHIKTELGA